MIYLPLKKYFILLDFRVYGLWCLYGTSGGSPQREIHLLSWVNLWYHFRASTRDCNLEMHSSSFSLLIFSGTCMKAEMIVGVVSTKSGHKKMCFVFLYSDFQISCYHAF